MARKARTFEAAEPLPEYNISNIVPEDPTMPYDVKDVIRAIVDNSDFFEIMELYAKNIVIGFGRMGGRTTGFVANQPLEMAGVLDVDSSDKAARFIRYCDAFNIPIITLVDLPGYLPGVDQEHAGVIRHGAKAALCLQRSYRSKADCDSEKSIRRRIYSNELQASARRFCICLAHSRDSSHGTRRCCKYYFQKRDNLC